MTTRATKIIATASIVGFHRWEGAPEDVAYLSRNHRHVFTFRVELLVSHGDREAEFHTVQRALRWMLPRLAKEAPMASCPEEAWFGGQSCEMLAAALFNQLVACGYTPTAIECWEDNENAGRVEFA